MKRILGNQNGQWNTKNYLENFQNMPLLQSKQEALPFMFK